MLSFQTHVGVGLHTRQTGGWGASKSNLEVSLVCGGVLAIIEGTRTDSIAYDSWTGYTTYGSCVYFLEIDRPGRAVIWWPKVTHPATWSGPYIYVPFWMLIVLFTSFVWLLRPRSTKAEGRCSVCGYPRVGIAVTAPCPECGNPPPPVAHDPLAS